MWKPEGLGQTIFQERYAHDGDNWESACRRVAQHVAQAEGDPGEWNERFYDELTSNRFCPGGRTWYGAGRAKAQLLNCLRGDTLIHTSNRGLVPIKELVGKKLCVSQMAASPSTEAPVEFFSYGEQELWTIVMKNGDEMYATAQHEWVVSRPSGGYERVTTDRLAGRRIPMQHHVLSEPDYAPYRRGVQHGLVWGDGNLYMNGSYAMIQQFSDSRDLVTRFFDDSREWPSTGATVATKLPAHYKNLPSLDDDHDYLLGFVAGAIASDGCVDSRGHVMLHQANKDALVRIRQIAASIGLPASSLKLVRKLNPWTGEVAPLWKLSFVKAGFFTYDGKLDEYLILKQKHRDYLRACPASKKQFTVEVATVVPTGIVEEVYCGVNNETHTLVIGPGYVTGNCFVLPTSDSREGWGKTVSDVIVVSGTGGGVGINCSPVRPRGYDIKGTGGKATGAVSLMQLINKVSDVVVGGGTRRSALMLCLDIDHPDVEEFLNVKLDLGQLNYANVSVVLNRPSSEFQQAVAQGKDLPLRFGDSDSGRHFNATDLWSRLVENAWRSGEPGVLNGWEANQKNNIWYKKPLIATNPCLTGDTEIMTLDGPRSFQSLAEDGRDVLVYAWHPKTKKPVVRWMRKPRLTRNNADLLEVEFDSGLKVRCTPDHNFFSFRGAKVKAQNLKIGQSVRAWSMSEHRDGHLRVHGWDAERNCADHQWVARMIFENAHGEIPEGAIIHHKNENPQDNSLENLELIANNSEHNILHYPARAVAGFNGKSKNHKVVAIRTAGTGDVYNGTVDDAHSYIVVDPNPIAGIASGVVSANCGEIFLEEYGCCCLGALVLPRFVSSGRMDWDLLAESVRSGIRFLDNTLTVNHFPLPEIRRNCLDVRRLGLGVMGLHSMLLELGHRYSSNSGRNFIDQLFSFIKEESYLASIDLAKEKGPFSAFDIRFLESGFTKTLSKEITDKIRENGIRNCAMLTVAPTGTTSMVAGVSSGIEPLFAPVYYRNYRKIDENANEHKTRELVITPEFKRFGDLAEGAYDLSPTDHFEVQRIVQCHIDNAVSKTINLPTNYPSERLSSVWLDYMPHIKGSTIYRSGSRGNEPLEPIPHDEIRLAIAIDRSKQVHEDNWEELNSLDCPGGVCDVRKPVAI